MNKSLDLGRMLTNISIRWKIYFVISALLVLMALAFTFVVERKISHYFHQEHFKTTGLIVKMLADDAVKPILGQDLIGLHNLISHTLEIEKSLRYIYVLSPSQRVLAHTFVGGFPSDLITRQDRGALSGGVVNREFGTDQGMIHEAVSPILLGELGSMHVGMSADGMVSSIAEIRFDLTWITATLCLIGLIISLIVSRLITRPISSLVAATERISEGEFDSAVSGESTDEIGTLAKAFNDMAKSLQRNMAGREEIEKALRESQKLYSSLVENIDLGITFIDKEHSIVIANSAQAKIFGLEHSELAGKKCYQVFCHNDEICKNCPGVLTMEGDRALTSQKERTRWDGTRFTIKTRTFPVTSDSGAILGFVEVAEDITEQLLMQRELQKVEKLESIGQLAAGLAHDFNNLLAAVLGNIELTKITIAPDAPSFQRLDAAEEACGQARVLANQLLTFSRGGSPQTSRVLIPQLLEDSCKFALSGASVKWVVDAPSHIWPAELDKAQMMQVIQAILLNAKDASKACDKILVIAENIELADAGDVPLGDGKYIRISINDEGCGIRNDILPKIFDPYFSTKEMGAQKGLGLGLTICHSIIKKHGGHITVNSREGIGTSVIIYLPQASDRIVSTSAAVEMGRRHDPSGSHRVLLLEDDRELAKIMANMLVHLNHKFTVAHTGNEAVLLHKQAIDEGCPYDLLILDLTVRGGIGGHETLQKIRLTDENVRAIVSSGYADNQIMLNCEEYGFAGALAKPFTFSDLDSVINLVFSP